MFDYSFFWVEGVLEFPDSSNACSESPLYINTIMTSNKRVYKHSKNNDPQLFQ